MLTGLYAGAVSLDAFEKQQNVSAANLANVSTPGYRRRIAFMGHMPDDSVRTNRNNLKVPQFSVTLDFSPGNIHHTGNTMDLAIVDNARHDGNAFFALTDRSGRQWYARSAQMEVDARGQLLHGASGFSFVFPNGAPVQLTPGGSSLKIGDHGAIIQDGAEVGQLKMVRFQDLQNVQTGPHGLFSPGPRNHTQPVDSTVQVKQGYREASNANAVDELVSMIANYRAYEATQRIIKQMDQSAQRLLRQTA